MLNKRMKYLVLALIFCVTVGVSANPKDQRGVNEQLAALEKKHNGRLGIYAVNTKNDYVIAYHAQERFPLCSTSKLMGVAAVLKKSMADQSLLKKPIHFTGSDLVSAWSPITKQHTKDGMTVSELSEAAITLSDNTAINLLMTELGGPMAVTDFARSIGDTTFRLDRWEPKLNSAIPGDPRDTSTPESMAKSLQALALGEALGQPQRELLKTWLRSNKVGAGRIEAGVPAEWIVGDKTGTCGNHGVTNDVGIIWPKQGEPIVVAIYFSQPAKSAKAKSEAIADATKILVDAFGSRSKKLG